MKMTTTKPNTSWSKGNPERWAPFDKDGGLVGYDGYSYRDIHWREVSDPIALTLEFDSYSRGRSAVTFHWKDILTGAKFPMFAKDFTDILDEFGSIDKIISGKWKVQKRGSNYGLKLVEKLENV